MIGLLATAACGRYQFDSQPDAANPQVESDGRSDGQASTCAVTFCDDFDAGTVGAGWDPPMMVGNATFALSTDYSVSAPSSLLLSLPAPELATGMLLKRLPFTATSARVVFEVSYASATPGTAEIDLVRLKWDALPPPCTSFGFYLVRDGTRPFDLQETYGGCGGNENTPFAELDNTGFHHVEMLVTFGPIGTARVRVDIDGAAMVDKLTSHAIDPSTLTLQVGGAAVRNMSAPWQIHYDNVSVELR